MIRKHSPYRHGHNRPQGMGQKQQENKGQDRLGQLIQKATNLASGLTTSRYTASRQNLRIIPMGGIEDVGENMTVLEYGDDLIVIDMGLAFPDDTMPGIDY
ncbi:MAG: hypothetical protein NTX98_03240, partial [Candidatus Doudnabacteria bacterium]|nr:hypothetical protein [Candidatus Doudnabacteria bacterium]